MAGRDEEQKEQKEEEDETKEAEKKTVRIIRRQKRERDEEEESRTGTDTGKMMTEVQELLQEFRAKRKKTAQERLDGV